MGGVAIGSLAAVGAGVAAPVLAAAVILPRAVNVGAVAGAVVHQRAAGTAVFIPVAAAP